MEGVRWPVTQCVDNWKQATSYWETDALLFELLRDAVPGFPAYTEPDCPFGLKGEFEFDAAEWPGVALY